MAIGTADPLGDTRTQNIIKLTEKAMTRPEGGWDLIHGKLMVFTDPQRGLLPIDRLEGFRPGGHSMYQRVLVAVELNGLIWPVWFYNYKPGHNADRIVLATGI